MRTSVFTNVVDSTEKSEFGIAGEHTATNLNLYANAEIILCGTNYRVTKFFS